MTPVAVDEKPGVQAIGNTAPDLPPVPGQHPTVSRDHEYKRYGTLSILASLDLHDGHVIVRVEERHRSAEFIALLKELDAWYPAHCTIRIILDNHSAHISKETRAWLANVPTDSNTCSHPRTAPGSTLPRHCLQDGPNLSETHPSSIQAGVEGTASRKELPKSMRNRSFIAGKPLMRSKKFWILFNETLHRANSLRTVDGFRTGVFPTQGGNWFERQWQPAAVSRINQCFPRKRSRTATARGCPRPNARNAGESTLLFTTFEFPLFVRLFNPTRQAQR